MGGARAAVALLVAALAGYVLLCAFLDVPADEDAFIYYRYGTHLAQGRGLVFNPGERVEGFSSPLWMLVVAGLALLGLDLPAAAPVASSLCGALSLTAVFRLARRVGLTPAAAAPAVLAVALFEPFVRWCKSGLDTALFALLIACAVEAALALGEQPPAAAPQPHGADPGPACPEEPGQPLAAAPQPRGAARRPWLLAALVLLAALARPEGILLGLAIVASHGGCAPARARPVRQALLAALAGYAVFLAARLFGYGALTPNTGVKFNPYLALRGARQVVSYLLFTGLAPAAVPLAALVRARRRGEQPVPGVCLMATTIAVVSVLFTVLSGGDYRAGYRYLVPTFPLLVVSFWSCVEPAARRARAPLGSIVRLAALAALLGTSVGPLYRGTLAAGAWRRALAEWRDPLANADDYHAAAARWLAAHAQSGQVIAFGQMGKAPYYALCAGKDLVFVDMLGLVDAEVARLLGWPHKAVAYLRALGAGMGPAAAYAAARAALYRAAADYVVAARRPDLIVLETALLDRALVRAVLAHPGFRACYQRSAPAPEDGSGAAPPGFIVYARTCGALDAPR